MVESERSNICYRKKRVRFSEVFTNGQFTGKCGGGDLHELIREISGA